MKKEKFTSWLVPVPEKEYVRCVYVGKLQFVPNETQHEERKSDGDLSLRSNRTVYDMMDDIWKESSVWNKTNCISGHLAWTESLHVAQLIEGQSEVVETLMEKIRRDPRVMIYKEFRKNVQVKNTGWDTSMCYSFDLPALLPGFDKDAGLSIQELFDSIGDTFEVKRDMWGLASFYENSIDRILMKWVAQEKESTKEVNTDKNTDMYSNACVVL